MMGLFWNYSGAGKKGMTPCLSGLIGDHSLDFLCLKETMKKIYLASYFRKVDFNDSFSWEWIPSGGLFVWCEKKLEIISC